MLHAASAQVALVGTVGEGLEIAHVAPYLADTRFDGDAHLLALFASREDQIRFVLKSLPAMGVSEPPSCNSGREDVPCQAG